MTEYDFDELIKLIGKNRIPEHGSIPAAWWITTEEAQVTSYDRWKADYQSHVDKVEIFAAALGLTSKQAMLSRWGGRSILTGFAAPQGMYLWAQHPNHVPIPEGWRLDKKTDRLVPSRKTKADRESQANRDFTALKVVPDVQSYLTGMPTEVYLEDRGFGGTIYSVQYRRGDECVMAFSGGDPDRSPDKLVIDAGVWHRQKLSALLALREAVVAS